MNDLNQKIEYFENELVKTNNYKNKLKLYRQYAFFMLSNDPDNALEIINKGYTCSLQFEDEYEQKVMYFLKGVCLIELKIYDQALQILLESKDYFYQLNKKIFYAKALSNIAVIYFELEFFNQAIYIWRDLLLNHIDYQDTSFKNIVLNNLISAYQNSFRFNEYSEIEIDSILKHYIDNNLEIDHNYVNALNNLAVFYRLSNNFLKAIEIGVESYSLAFNNNYEKIRYEICINLALCYKEVNDNRNVIRYLLIALKISNKTKYDFLKDELYRLLYLYYKNKNILSKSLKYLENLHEFQAQKEEIKIKIFKTYKIENWNSNLLTNLSMFNNYVKNNLFDWDRNLYIENIKGVVMKVNVDSIVCALASNKFLKIVFPNNKTVIFKKSFKDFLNMLEGKFGDNHMFFITNQRSEIINLYWFSSFDKLKKKIYLNVLGVEYTSSITRTQMPKILNILFCDK